MNCIDCGEDMVDLQKVVRSAWGDGPEVYVIVPVSWCKCMSITLSPMAARVVQDVAYHAATGEWR